MLLSSPRLKLAFLVLAALLAAGAGFWWLQRHGYNVRVAIDEGIAVLRAAGPAVFFTAMAVLPAFGCPMSIFHLTAASAFSAQLGLGGVLAAAGAALAVNIALTYWLARQGLRPWIEQLLQGTKYRIPQLDRTDHAELTLLMRITPGPPFFMQGYLLGLAGVAFGTYMWISWVVAMGLGSGLIVFGDAILHGKARLAFLGLSAIVAVSLIIHFVRRHYGKKRT